MKIEAHVKDKNGESHRAIFEAIEIGRQIWLVLDQGMGSEVQPTLFHPPQKALIPTSERGLSYLYLEQPVPVENQMALPQARRGFFLID